MTQFNFSQLEQLWVQNGGNPSMAPTMAAIAMAESGGNSNAFNNNPNTGDFSVGLWQTNYFGNMLGPRSQQYGTPAQLQANPNLQAKSAVGISGNSPAGLGNWSTYTNGAFQQYLNGGTPAPQYQTLSAKKSGSSDCFLGFPGISIPVVGNAGSFCIISRGQIRGLVGGLLIVSGAFVGLFGVALLMGQKSKIMQIVPSPIQPIANRVNYRREERAHNERVRRSSELAYSRSEASAAGRRSGSEQMPSRTIDFDDF